MTLRDLLKELNKLTDAQLDRPLIVFVRNDYYTFGGVDDVCEENGWTPEDLEDQEGTDLKMGDFVIIT
jgi:hypothetical protein